MFQDGVVSKGDTLGMREDAETKALMRGLQEKIQAPSGFALEGVLLRTNHDPGQRLSEEMESQFPGNVQPSPCVAERDEESQDRSIFEQRRALAHLR